MATSVCLILMTRGALDVRDEMLACVYDAFADQGGDDPDEPTAEMMINVVWTRAVKANDGRRLHRVTFTPGAPGTYDDALCHALIKNFVDQVKTRVGPADPGIAHLVRFNNDAQLTRHAKLYAEMYDIEMRLREALTFIFLDEFPNRPYDFISATNIKMDGDPSQHSEEYLSTHYENQLFQIVFKSYLGLNNPMTPTVANIFNAIRDQPKYEGLRAAVAEVPIKKESHAAFLASLLPILPQIEAVRNAIAHNRDIPNLAEQRYGEARDRFYEKLAAFWAAENEQ